MVHAIVSTVPNKHMGLCYFLLPVVNHNKVQLDDTIFYWKF